VIYADTDSLHIQCDFDEVDMIEEMLNDMLASYTGGKLDIKFEKYFRAVLFKGVKKRYAAHVIWDGKDCDYIHKVGIEAKRSDSARITREVMNTFLHYVLREDDVEAAIQTLKREIQNFKNNDLVRIAIPKGLQQPLDEYVKDFPHLIGIKFAIDHLKLKFREDKRPKLLKVKHVANKRTKYVCFYDEPPKNVVVDWNAMLEATLKKKFEGLLRAVGTSWTDVVTGTKQKVLSDYA